MSLLPFTSRPLIRTAAGRVLPLVKRPYTTPPRKHKSEEVHNYNTPEFYWEGYEDREDDEHNYPRVTAQELAKRRKPPTGVKMLVRDFIQDSLYNPHYGYFSKRAIIFSTDEPFNFNCLPENAAFQSEVARVYQQYEQGDPDDPRNKGPGRQIWHTPTELFKPYYGQAIAQCLVSEYLLKYFPYEDLVIYETGAGNGTLALNILDCLKDAYPEVYERTRYRIIEISPHLAGIQRSALQSHSMAEVYNQDVFQWQQHVPEPCFFLAMEVVDNFPHDVLRYSMDDLRPYQGLISISPTGYIDEIYEPVHDPLILRFLSYRNVTGRRPAPLSRINTSPLYHKWRRFLPLAPNLSKPEYIPTKILALLELLSRYFPLHRLLLSDFSSLPDAVEGYNAPVVQTRVKGTVVPVTTLCVQPGYFDIFFPTSFELLRDIYEVVLQRPLNDTGPKYTARFSPMGTTASSVRLGAGFFSSNLHQLGRRTPLDGLASTSGLPIGQKQSAVSTHRAFMEKYANLGATRLMNGENPLLDHYQNVKYLF